MPDEVATQVMQQFAETKIVPVIVLQSAGRADALAAALLAGNLPIAEVTFRTAAAADAIATMAKHDGLLVGAGTVISPDQVDQAVDAGARFVVSPGFSATVAQRCADHGIPLFPGVTSATEIMMALEAGITTVKFFPAGTSGGSAAIKALSAPFPQVRFVPTGGITTSNLDEYLALPSILAIGGSWMVPADALAAGDTDTITRLAAEAVGTAARLRP